jgi:hypothetical protein
MPTPVHAIAAPNPHLQIPRAPDHSRRRRVPHLASAAGPPRAEPLPAGLEHPIHKTPAPDRHPIPDYAYDCHTPQGRKMGKTKAEFFKAEQEALNPFIPGLFDDLIDS